MNIFVLYRKISKNKTLLVNMSYLYIVHHIYISHSYFKSDTCQKVKFSRKG